MKIDLRNPRPPIAKLTTDELPDFAVLIGRNGAGKTQLLEALAAGWAEISGIDVNEIEKYDMVDFRPSNTSEANRGTNQFAQMTVDAYLLSPPGGQPLNKSAAAIFDQCANEIECCSGVQAREAFERNLRHEIRQTPDFAVFAAGDQESPYKQTLYKQVLARLKRGNAARQHKRSSNQPQYTFDGNQAALLSAAMKLTGRLPHELTRQDIVRASHSEGDTISNSISAVFAAYKFDQYMSAHKRIETERIDFPELIADYENNYPPPWDTLRKILSEMRDATGNDGLFDFEFSDPGDHELDFGNSERFSFKSVMTNRTTGARYELDSLSSGEKILMTLCFVSFNQYLGKRRPKLLLLDELDALLHPSMVAALVRTLKTLFVPQGTKVLMTSHSPMTVAALDEADIFRVVRTGGDVQISRTTKSEAINELSEGLATVDVGLSIAAYDEAKVTILTEGNNANHLKRWIEVTGLLEDVHVFEELGQHTNDEQLLAYGRLLARMHTNTHFVIVWDCDADGKSETLRGELPRDAKITPYAFEKRADNSIAQRGIENNYDEDILEPYSIMTRRSDGTLLSRGFDNSRKTEFANHVLQKGTPQYFTNFHDLHAIVSGILGSPEKA